MVTLPGLPGPQITPYLTRAASRATYAPGTEFAIDSLTMIGNTGTYLDAPYHRYAGGADLSGIPLERTADLPAVVVRVAGARQLAVDVGALAALDVAGKAVLLHTGDAARFGTPGYAQDRHYLTRAGAAWLADHGAALVGIDALNIDDTADGERPAHTLLLAAGIPVVEHLTGLDQLPPSGRGSPRFRCASTNSAPSRCGRSPACLGRDAARTPAGPGIAVAPRHISPGTAARPFRRELGALPWFLIVVAGLFETAFAILLKQSHNFTRLWPTVGFVVCALISFGLLNLALNRLEVGPAYAVWTGIGAAGTAVVGIVVLGESNSPLKLVSIGLVLLGVIGLNLWGVTP